MISAVLDDPAVPARWSLCAVLAVALQDAVLWRMSIFDAHPELPLLLAVTAGVVVGARRGCIVGFWIGLLADAVSGSIVGLNALAYSIAGYMAGTADDLLLSDETPIRAVQIGAASMLSILLQAAVGEVFGRPYMNGWSFLRVAVVVGCLHMPLSVVSIRVVQWADPEER